MTAARDLLASLAGAASGNGSPPAAAPLRALAWARVSTDLQRDRALSIPEQIREIRTFAEARGIEIADIFQEVASAFRRDEQRVEFRRMLERARTDPAIDTILVHDFSRFSRDSLMARTLVRELREAGVRVVSATDPEADPETVAGVYLEAITHAKNEAYSREVSFHTKKGCRANAQARDPETGWCYKNGGQALWGYRSRRIEQGADRRGRPVFKTIWELDDTVVSGKPVHEWVRYCLLELAATGASLNELRDFCEQKGLPARRKAHWSASTWQALLQPDVLLKYCGYGVWNVHGKRGKRRDPSEWLIVERAHPAILTPEEAKRVAQARREVSDRASRFRNGRSRRSEYLLSGGLFTCGRCGSNMTGFAVPGGPYYVCGSAPYRRGKGCGRGVYVPVSLIEGEAIRGVERLVSHCADPQGFTRMVNEELKKLWETEVGHDPTAPRRLKEVEGKIANVRSAVEDGLEDAAWANTRLQELMRERDALERAQSQSRPPKVTVEEAMRYRRDFETVFEAGTPAERKKFLRLWIEEIKLAPERLEIELTFRVPELFMIDLVAGAGFEPATFGL